MNPPEETPRSRPPLMSPEAMVGLGITIATLGVLFLLLGWAQWMRQVHDAATIFLAIGAVMFVLGTIGTLFGRTGKRT